MQRNIRLVFAAILFFSLMLSAHSEPYPSKPIRIIVPAGAGTPPDVRMRWLAERLTPALGQRMVIENKPGAGGILGAALGAKSAPDGYTLIAVTQGTMAFNPFLYADPGYDALKDFAPITRMTTASMVLVVNPSAPARTVKDLIGMAKTRPGELTFGSAGVGTPPHMAGALFQRAAGVDIDVVLYKSGNMAHLDVMADRLTYTIDGIGILLPFIHAGKLKALAVTSSHRLGTLPEVPTLAESGLQGFDFDTWNGLVAPAGTPKEIIQRLNVEFVKVLKTAQTREWFATQGAVPIGDSPEEFAAMIKSDYEKWGEIIRATGMKGE